MSKRKIISICTVLLLAMSLLLSSCVTKTDKGADNTITKPTEGSTTISTDSVKLSEKPSGKLTIWVKYGGTPPEGYESFNDTPFVQELRRLSGVDVEFICPPTGQDKEAFNLMIASREFPDIIEKPFQSEYPGGADKAIADKVIIPLDDVMKQYNPNVLKALEENPDVKQTIRSASGVVFAYPTIKPDPRQLNTAGPAIRKDWLDEFDLSVPETIDEWEVALRTFKEKKNVIPMTGRLTVLFSSGTPFAAWGAPYGEFIDNGKVYYGAIEPGFKEFLAMMNAWYKDGLLDPNIASLDRKTEVSNMVDGRAGSMYTANASSGVGEYNIAGKKVDPKYSVVGTKYPVLKKGDVPKFGIKTDPGMGYAQITIACKNVELAAYFMDFVFSEEGSRLYNFGIEGKTYEMVNGKPQYIKIDGNLNDSIALYSKRDNRVGIVDGDAYVQTLTVKEAQDALGLWAFNNMPQNEIKGYWLNETEAGENAKLRTDLNTYAQEMIFKYIVGGASLDTFDTEFVPQMKKYGVTKIVENIQKAYDRNK